MRVAFHRTFRNCPMFSLNTPTPDSRGPDPDGHTPWQAATGTRGGRDLQRGDQRPGAVVAPLHDADLRPGAEQQEHADTGPAQHHFRCAADSHGRPGRTARPASRTARQPPRACIRSAPPASRSEHDRRDGIRPRDRPLEDLAQRARGLAGAVHHGAIRSALVSVVPDSGVPDSPGPRIRFAVRRGRSGRLSCCAARGLRAPDCPSSRRIAGAR